MHKNKIKMKFAFHTNNGELTCISFFTTVYPLHFPLELENVFPYDIALFNKNIKYYMSAGVFCVHIIQTSACIYNGCNTQL